MASVHGLRWGLGGAFLYPDTSDYRVLTDSISGTDGPGTSSLRKPGTFVILDTHHTRPTKETIWGDTVVRA